MAILRPPPALLQSWRPRVFVTQETAFDFKPAEQFGDVQFLIGLDLVNIKNSEHNTRLLRELHRKLRRFSPDRDWLLIAGSPYVSAAVFLILGQLGVHQLQLLRWSNRDGVYIPLHIDSRSITLFNDA